LYSDRSALPSPRLLSGAEEQDVWEEIIGASTGENPLLQIAPTARVVGDAWKLLCAWHLPLSAPEWDDTADTEAFAAWVATFITEAETHNWLSGAQLVDFVIDRFEVGELAVPEQIELAGFVELTPDQDLLLTTLQGLGSEISERSASEVDDDHQAHRLACNDPAEEVRVAAAWARSILLNYTDDSDRSRIPIGFIVPDLEAYRSRIDRVFDEVFHPDTQMVPEPDAPRVFNISLGPSLAEYPIIDAAFLILAVDRDRIPLESASRFIRSPFVGGASEEWTGRGRLDAVLRFPREPEVHFDQIQGLAAKSDSAHGCPGLAACMGQWVEVHSAMELRQMPSDWAESFSKLLKAMGWPGGRGLSSTEYQTVLAWRKVLAEFASIDQSSGPLDKDAALDRLRRLARDRQFQPESEPAPIQVLGVYEASGLEFDHLWIMGAHDGAWPGANSPNPFLPRRLQSQLSMPASSPTLILDNARLMTARMLGAAPVVVVSHPEKEGDSQLRVSPLLSSLGETSVEDLGVSVPAPYAERMLAQATIVTIGDDRGPVWAGGNASGGTEIFRLQAACPFRAFAQLRLGADVLRVAEVGLSPIDRGHLVHNALGRVWNELQSHDGLMSTSSGRLEALVKMAVGAAISDMAETRSALRQLRFAGIEQARLERLLEEWLETEKARRPFTVVHQEAKRKATVGGVPVSLRPDRVDRLDDDTVIVIDYKTGEHGPREWDGPRPDQPQLPLYAVTTDRPVSGVFFATLKTGKSGFKGLASADGIVPGVRRGKVEQPVADAIGEWTADLERLGDEFREGRATVDPKSRSATCAYCHLDTLCRVSESALLSDEEQESDRA